MERLGIGKFGPDLNTFLYNIWFKIWLQQLDNAMICISLTSHEKQNATLIFNANRYLKFVLYFFIFIILTPIGSVLYIIWFIIYRKLLRFENFQKSVRINRISDIKEYQMLNDKNKEFEILSINVCLLPDSLSRENNLCYTNERLIAIGNLLNKSEPNTFCVTKFIPNRWHYKYLRSIYRSRDLDSIQEESGPHFRSEMNVRVIDDYIDSTDIDFLCMQEVWTIDMAKKLTHLLHKKYPYIIYDAGEKTFRDNRYIGFESGLLIASKYKIIASSFQQYSTKSGMCSYTSKGLLIVKVLIKQNINERSVVGFVSNTHLQSYQIKNDNIHSNQLAEIQLWLTDFKKVHFDSKNEIIAFDIICGDFNIDNMSPVDKKSYEHQIFKEYKDPLALKPGVDHPQAIGTEMRFFSIYHQMTSCPQKFKNALENHKLRRLFILDSNIELAMPEMCKENPSIEEDGLPAYLPLNGGNRRVDRILYNKLHSLNLLEYKFITSFTRLTDHIPISMKFKCNSY